MEHYPTEYLQHPLPVLVVVGLNPTFLKSNTNSPNPKPKELNEGDASKEGQEKRHSSESLSHHPLSAPVNPKNSLIASTSKKIGDLLGVDLPPSIWESGKIYTTSSSTSLVSAGLNNFGLVNRNSGINTGVSTLVAGSERAFTSIIGSKSDIFPNKRQKSVPGMASTHSVLSPSSPVSPLYPDGIMTPLWLRRHFMDFPSGILAFYELWLPSEDVGSEQHRLNQFLFQPNGASSNPPYRERDLALAAEISEARKSAQENNMKFAAVIWNLSRHEGDEIMLDRLTQLRKGSGLDSRTGFFVLDRRNVENLPEFISGIIKVIHEPALQRYREYYRRTKRKLARLPALPPSAPSALPTQGWIVRYEFKLAQFSMLRGDIEGAVKHFEAAYCALSELLYDGNVGKSREDASFLIDAVSFHICRIYLYQDNGQTALLQLQRHVRGFGELWDLSSRNQWMSRQFRLFADLLDWAVRSGKDFEFGRKIPLLRRTPPVGLFQIGNQTSWRRPTYTSQAEGQGTHPLAVLHHPGYYYYEAARNLTGPEQSQAVIEALSKSYEQFKRHHGDRMTLKVASAIAAAYLQSDKHELAIKFYDRIAKAYRKEPWPQLLCAALQQALICALKLDQRDLILHHSIELLSPSFKMDIPSRQKTLNQLLETLQSPCKDPSTPLEIDLDPSTSFLAISAGFGCSSAVVQQPIILQLCISSTIYPGAELQISNLKVAFSDPSLDFTIENDPSLPDALIIETDALAPLCLKHGVPLVIQKALLVNQAAEIKMTSVTLHLSSPHWVLALKHDLRKKSYWFTASSNGELLRSKFPSGADPLTCRVNPPPPLLELRVVGPIHAYVNEACPINIHLYSEEEEPIEVSLCWEWLNSPMEDQLCIESDFPAPETIAAGIVEPSKEAQKTLQALFLNDAGIRHLSIKVRFTRPSFPDQVFEVASAIEIQVRLPFTCHFKCYPLPGLSCAEPISLFQRLAPSQNLRRKIMLVSQVTPAETLHVHKLELMSQESMITSIGSEWEAQTTQLVNHLIEVAAPISSVSDPHPTWNLQLGPLRIRWQRPDSVASEYVISIPKMELPVLRVSIELSFPSLILEGEPFTLVYTIANTTPSTEEVVCRVDASDLPLVYAGWRVANRRLLPFSITKLTVTCHALAHGRFPAPRLAIERKEKASDDTSPLGLTYGWALEAPILLVKPHPPQMDSSIAMLDERVVV